MKGNWWFLFFAPLLVFLASHSAFAADQVFFYHTDPVGTPLAMTDAMGNVVWKADYKPFGEENSVTGNQANNKQFVGKEKDEETGLNYFGARYMESKVGRFTAVDPVRAVKYHTSSTDERILLDPQKLNLYAYAVNNPYRYVDPFGLAVSLNLFSKYDTNNLYFKAQQVREIRGIFTVGMHSSPLSFRDGNNPIHYKDAAYILAQKIRGGGWKEGTPVLLIGCYSGADPSSAADPTTAKQYGSFSSLAQRLANELKTLVGGATAYVWYDGKGYLPGVAPDGNGIDWSLYRSGDHLTQSKDKKGSYVWYKPQK